MADENQRLRAGRFEEPTVSHSRIAFDAMSAALNSASSSSGGALFISDVEEYLTRRVATEVANRSIPNGAAILLAFVRRMEVGRDDHASDDVIYGQKQNRLPKPLTSAISSISGRSGKCQRKRHDHHIVW